MEALQKQMFQQLLQLEHKARERTQQGETQYQVTLQALEDKKQSMQTEEQAHAQRRIAAVRESEERYIQEQMRNIHQRLAENVASLQQQYAQQQEIWVQALLERCIGGDDSEIRG